MLAESYPLLLEGMKFVLESEPGFRVLAACSDGMEALRAVRRHHPNVLIIDLETAGDSLEILRELSGERLSTRVVLFAARLDETVMLEGMRLGASGIVLKSMASHQLVRCVRKVHRGGTWFEKVSMGRVIDRLLRHEVSVHDVSALLSRRELEVVRMVTSCGSNKEIADKLNISRGTVRVHLHHVYEKLGVRSRLELTLYARDKGLLSPLPDRARRAAS